MKLHSLLGPQHRLYFLPQACYFNPITRRQNLYCFGGKIMTPEVQTQLGFNGREVTTVQG